MLYIHTRASSIQEERESSSSRRCDQQVHSQVCQVQSFMSWPPACERKGFSHLWIPSFRVCSFQTWHCSVPSKSRHVVVRIREVRRARPFLAEHQWLSEFTTHGPRTPKIAKIAKSSNLNNYTTHLLWPHLHVAIWELPLPLALQKAEKLIL